ncbi:site-specific recombinase, phage integrase family domain protein [Streptococcus intermedius BA1]|nr:site-specific recombinase, phage integrase family domain protein [Streptococcus intermedius BA1]
MFRAPKELMDILKEWKKEQRRQLKLFGIKQSEKQFLFTFKVLVPIRLEYP